MGKSTAFGIRRGRDDVAKPRRRVHETAGADVGFREDVVHDLPRLRSLVVVDDMDEPVGAFRRVGIGPPYKAAGSATESGMPSAIRT